MTIQEAINSGKPFRRKLSFTGWLWISSSDEIVYISNYDEKLFVASLSKDDILADDWVVREE